MPAKRPVGCKMRQSPHLACKRLACRCRQPQELLFVTCRPGGNSLDFLVRRCPASSAQVPSILLGLRTSGSGFSLKKSLMTPVPTGLRASYCGQLLVHCLRRAGYTKLAACMTRGYYSASHIKETGIS